MNCHQVQKYLHAHLDGELSPDVSLEIEKHLEGCVRCREQMEFEIEFIDRVRSALLQKVDVGKLGSRIEAGLDDEDSVKDRRRFFYRVSFLAVAASVVLIFGLAIRSAVINKKSTLPAVDFSDEVVARHTHQMPLEIKSSDAREVSKWFEGKIDFPVEPPQFSPEIKAKLLGGRISRIREKDAAQLIYDVGGHKMTFLIFNPNDGRERFNIEQVSTSARRLPHNRGWVTTRRGYSVGLYRKRGIAYTFTSDLDEREIMRLMTMVR